MVRRIALDGWGRIPSQDLVDLLQCTWAFQAPMYAPVSDPNLAESEWRWCIGKKYVDLGITNLIGEYECREDHAHQMIVLRNQLALSLNHPEIVGIYINDTFSSLRDGFRTREQIEEAIQEIRNTNPNLDIVILYNIWDEEDATTIDYLSWLDFDAVNLNYRLRAGTPPRGIDGMSAFLTEAEHMFMGLGKQVWLSALTHDTHNAILSESEYRQQCQILRLHYDTMTIEGIRVQHVRRLMEQPQYATWTAEELLEATPPAPPPPPPSCIIAFLASAMGLASVLPSLRQLRSHLPKWIVTKYYQTSDAIMGVIL